MAVRVLVALLAVSVAASAAEVKILSVGAVQPGLGQLAEQFKKEAGHDIVIQVDTAPGLTKRLASGETADILLAPPAVIDENAKAGKVNASTRAMAARVGIGIAMRKGAKIPNVATADAFRQALLSADAIVYNEGSSGLYLEKLFGEMGITEQLKAKTVRYANGGQVVTHVIDGKANEIGLVPIPVILSNNARGLQLVGPLPAQIQNYTPYEAAVMAGSKAAAPAQDFIRYLATPAAKKIFASTGVE